MRQRKNESESDFNRRRLARGVEVELQADLVAAGFQPWASLSIENGRAYAAFAHNGEHVISTDLGAGVTAPTAAELEEALTDPAPLLEKMARIYLEGENA